MVLQCTEKTAGRGALSAALALMVTPHEPFNSNKAAAFQRSVLVAGAQRLVQVCCRMSADSTAAPYRNRKVKKSIDIFRAFSGMHGMRPGELPSTLGVRTWFQSWLSTLAQNPTLASQYPLLLRADAKVSVSPSNLLESEHSKRKRYTARLPSSAADQFRSGLSVGSGACGPRWRSTNLKLVFTTGKTTQEPNCAVSGGPGSPAEANEKTNLPGKPMLHFSSPHAHQVGSSEHCCRIITPTFARSSSTAVFAASSVADLRRACLSTAVSHGTGPPGERNTTNNGLLGSKLGLLHCSCSYSTTKYQHSYTSSFQPCCKTCPFNSPQTLGAALPVAESKYLCQLMCVDCPCSRGRPGRAKHGATFTSTNYLVATCAA